jgi:hypothetical protein
MKWAYLDLEEFNYRQKLVAKAFQHQTVILEVGSFDRKLREHLSDKFLGRIISCDPLIPNTVEYENGDIQFAGGLIECSKYLAKNSIEVDSIVALGLNMVQIDLDPELQMADYVSFIFSIAKVEIFAIEYPMRFFPAKVESEMAISLVLPKLILDETKDYTDDRIPAHARIRRLIIGKATTIPNVEEVERTFQNFRVNSYSPDRIFSNWKRCPQILVTLFGKSYKVPTLNVFISYGNKWSYLANLGSFDSKVIGIKCFGFFKGLTLSSATADSQAIHFEKSISGQGRLNIMAFVESEDTALIRFGNRRGFRMFCLLTYKPLD